MFWQKIKSGFKLISEFIQNLFSKIFLEAIGETKSNKFRFLFLTSTFAILFFILFFLIGKNPFSLLIPFSIYDLPSLENRKSITLYVSDGKNRLLKSQRKIHLVDNDLRKNLNIIIGELSQPPYDDVIESNDESVFPKKLIDMRSPIIAMWLLDSDKKLILDINEDIIKEELSAIKVKLEVNEDSIFESQSKEADNADKKKEEDIETARIGILNIALLALEKTVFENFPTIETIEFKLNGHSKDFSGLEYKLTEVKKRN